MQLTAHAIGMLDVFRVQFHRRFNPQCSSWSVWLMSWYIKRHSNLRSSRIMFIKMWEYKPAFETWTSRAKKLWKSDTHVFLSRSLCIGWVRKRAWSNLTSCVSVYSFQRCGEREMTNIFGRVFHLTFRRDCKFKEIFWIIKTQDFRIIKYMYD